MIGKLSVGKLRYFALLVGIWMILYFLLNIKLTSVAPGAAPACKQEGEQVASSPSQESGLEDLNRFANSSAACICESMTTDRSTENHKDVVGTEVLGYVSDEEHLRLHPHPGAGAKDEEGHWGYIHDAKFLRRNLNLSQFTIPDHERDQICAAPGKGPEGSRAAYRRLTKLIQILPEPQQNKQPIHDNRLFCAVYTYPGGDSRTEASINTWARRCDGFLAASTVTDAARGLVNLPHYGSYPGHYYGIWQKVRSMMTYIYEHYGSEYDYFHFNGDDTYVVVENLKAFLHEKRPRYVGLWFKPWWVPAKATPFTGSDWARLHPDFYYATGGPGYTLSQATLRFLVQEILPVCDATIDEPPEDVFVAQCLWHAGIRAEPHWDEKGINLFIQEGMKESKISRKSVSFHYIAQPALFRRMERLLYRRHLSDTDCLQV